MTAKHTHRDTAHCSDCHTEPMASREWLFVGFGLLAFLVAYESFKRLGVLAMPKEVESWATFGVIVVIGLAASVSSCLAVVGGLLLSVSAQWAELHRKQSTSERFKPLGLFNAGRLIGYFLFGGLVGLIGHSIALSTRTTGFITILLALVMIVLGLNILHIIPKKYCTLPFPQSFMKRLHRLSASRNPIAPLVLGALTFFIPCGYTLSMQLLALNTGSFLGGGLIMLTFALGTLPALLGISMVSALTRGRVAQRVFRFSGALVILLGMLNVQGGLTLMGVNTDTLFALRPSVLATGDDPHVRIDKNGQQIISLLVDDHGYTPSSVTIAAGKPTWVYAYANHKIAGCAAFLTAPTYNLEIPVNVGGNWLGPINDPQHDFLVACSMGMYKAQIRVKGS